MSRTRQLLGLLAGVLILSALVAPVSSAEFSSSASDRPTIAKTGTTKTTIKTYEKTVKSGATTKLVAEVSRIRALSKGSSLGKVTFTATPVVGKAITFKVKVKKVTTKVKKKTKVRYLATWSAKLPDGTYSVIAAFGGNAKVLGSKSKAISIKVGSSAPGGPAAPLIDTDGDRLDDLKELSIGTNPAKADTDGDAISDGDEVLGTTAGLNLVALGFSPLHKDFAIEFDWFDDSNECGSAHSHRPTATMISLLTSYYANLATTNPDGTTGIHLVVDYGQGGAFTGGSVVAGPTDGHINTEETEIEVLGGEFKPLKLANFASNRNGIFHYVFSAHRFVGFDALGVGELLGNDAVIANDCSYNNAPLIANALFHEEGHNFGLRHGGFEDQNNKPNYPSSMNYGNGDLGIDTNCDGVGDGVVGFSSGTLPDLDENALIEANGLCGPGHPVDLNKNGSIDAGPIAFNLNPGDGPGLTVLKDSNDIAQMSFAGLSDAD